MARALDFRTVKKKFLTTSFRDGNVILIRSPKLVNIESLIELSNKFSKANKDIQNGDTDTDDVKTVYQMCADIMNNNIQNKKITMEYLGKQLDIEDLTIFFQQYTEFVSEINTVAKN
ncbi:MAG: hypothetical protein E7262_02680 [Lachnospiraceae bacterium]|nr:hypothetical protein [Lachnospiraceae bacterium]